MATAGQVLGVRLPVLQPIARDLEIYVPGGVPGPVRLELGQAGVQGGQDPAKNSQHQEY